MGHFYPFKNDQRRRGGAVAEEDLRGACVHFYPASEQVCHPFEFDVHLRRMGRPRHVEGSLRIQFSIEDLVSGTP